MKCPISLLTIIVSLLLFDAVPVAAQAQVLKSLEEDINVLIESIKPSLVTIQTQTIKPLLPKRAGMEKHESVGPIFIGSGMIYDREGHILTTSSVTGGKEKFTVILPGGKEVEGKLIGTDPDYNLAVLKVDIKGLTPAKLGDSDKLRIGSWLTIVGNSYGLPSAVALGLMNGKREDGLLQMSADVSPGNSGGPVLNTKGEVVGLVTARVAEQSFIMRFSEENRGVSFSPGQLDLPASGVSLAIPINEVNQKADEIIKHGSIKRGYLGVYIGNLEEEELKRYALESGVKVERVEKDSPADKAGLQEGDIILSFEKGRIENAEQLSGVIKKTPPRTQIALEILRDGKKKNMKATLTESPSRYVDPFSRFFGQENFEQSPPGMEKYNEDLQNYIEAWKSQSKNHEQNLQEQLKELERRIQELEEKLKEKESH